MGSKVLEYIIRAKDATAAAINSARDRLISLGRSKPPKVEIKAEDKTKDGVDKARNRILDALGSIQKKADSALAPMFKKIGIDWKEMSDAAGNSIGQIIGKIPGIPNAFKSIIPKIGVSLSAIGALVLVAFSTWKRAIEKTADALAEKWRQTAQIVADNWRIMAQQMGEAFQKVSKDISRADEALARMQRNRAAMSQTEEDTAGHARALEREREMQSLMRNGGTVADATALQEKWEQEDKYLALLREEKEIDQQLWEIEERRARRRDAAAEMDEQIASAEAALRAANADAAKIAERAKEGDASMWSARRKRIQEEVEALAGANDDRMKAALGNFLGAFDQKYAYETQEEDDAALEERLRAQAEMLETRRKTVALSKENADAIEAAAEAEEKARQAAEEAERAKQKAAEEEERRQKNLAEEQRRRMEELERERERLAEKAYRKEVELARGALAESQKTQGDAQSRLADARSQVARAWGWYRNQDSMQAHIDDILAQREAEKQWEKDFEKLKSRARGNYDWRTVDVGKLSAHDEAVRQVALAKEEEAAAQKALDEIAENTRDLAGKLDELLSMKEA